MLKNDAIGIDLGSSRFIIAVIKKGGVEIITNEANYRQTPCVVTFDKHRSMGTESKAIIKKNLKNSIFNPTRYLSQLTQEELKLENFFNFVDVKFEKGIAQFQLQKDNNNQQISSYQAVSALFTKIKQICQQNNIACNDVVISIPSYYNSQERQAILDAAYIADLKPLRIFNETSALLINYSVFRKSDLDEQKPRIVGFIDFGYSKTTFILANVFKNHAEIIYQKNNRNLGVRNLDQNVVNHYINFFLMYNEIDLTTNPKSIFRLFENVEKQRIVLSTNKISPINIECIFDDHDLQVNLTLNDYLKITRDVVVQFQEFCRSIVNELVFNRFDISTIDSIERLGGGMRIPTFQDIVTKIFEIDKISKTLDADESIARGCAIQAAMLSPRYNVNKYVIKEHILNDINIKLGYQGQNILKEMKFFSQGSYFNKILSIQIQKNLPLYVKLIEKLPHKDLELLTADIKPVVGLNGNFKRTMYILLDINGLVSIRNIEINNKNQQDDQQQYQCQYIQKFEQELDEEILQQYIQIEKKFIENENQEKQLQQARYDYESFIYKTKDLISLEQYQKFLTPQEKANISQVLNKNEEWLNNATNDILNEVIYEKYQHLKDLCRTFYNRKNKIDKIQNFKEEMMPNYQSIREQNKLLQQNMNNSILNKNQQKINQCEQILQELQMILTSQELHAIDAYDFENQSMIFQNNIKEVSSSLDQINQDIKNNQGQENQNIVSDEY